MSVSNIALTFVYKLEINSINSKSIQDVIIDLEISFAETTLLALFSDGCLLLRGHRTNELNVIGVSTLPTDAVLIEGKLSL